MPDEYSTNCKVLDIVGGIAKLFRSQAFLASFQMSLDVFHGDGFANDLVVLHKFCIIVS